MKPVPIGETACARTLRYMDSYLASELLIETNHEVLRHLESCPACAAELESRTRLRTRLREAARAKSAPSDLRVRVRQRLERSGSRSFFASAGIRWAATAAMCVVVAAGTYVFTQRQSLPELADRSGQNAYIERVSHTVATVLRVGLGDHLHCSVFRHYPKNPPAVAEMEQKLGDYKGLLTLVQQNVPVQYRVVMAHQCGYNGRRFVHLTLQDGQRLMSLVIARKQAGETLAGLTATQSTGGIPVYQSAAQHYEVAGFETAQYLAFVVSDLAAARNLQIAGNLARAVHEYLQKAI